MKQIKYASQNINLSDIKNISKVLRNEFLTQGPKVQEFEDKLKKKFGSKYCIVTSSGSSALKLSVKSLNLNKNDYIIVPSNTFVAPSVLCRSVLFAAFESVLTCISVNILSVKGVALVQDKSIVPIFVADADSPLGVPGEAVIPLLWSFPATLGKDGFDIV